MSVKEYFDGWVKYENRCVEELEPQVRALESRLAAAEAALERVRVVRDALRDTSRDKELIPLHGRAAYKVAVDKIEAALENTNG